MKPLNDLIILQISFGVMLTALITYLLFLLGSAKIKLKSNLEYLKMIDALLIVNEFLNSDDVLYKLRLYASKIEFYKYGENSDRILGDHYCVTISSQALGLPDKLYAINANDIESDDAVDKWCSQIWEDYKNQIQELA
jgi:hypothetical protein